MHESCCATCRLLTKDPKKRPDARDALGHPWLKATGSKLALDGNDPYMQTISDEVARNLSKFAASNKLQRAFMHLAVTFIHKNEMQRMLAIFNKLNTDKHTPLPAADITAILTKGRRPSEAQEIAETVEVRAAACGYSLAGFVGNAPPKILRDGTPLKRCSSGTWNEAQEIGETVELRGCGADFRKFPERCPWNMCAVDSVEAMPTPPISDP